MYQNADFISAYALTQRFSSGRPRNFTIDNKQTTLYFLRAINQDTPTLGLFKFSTASERAELLINPLDLLDPAGSKIPAAEQARRERMRESGVGITSYQLDEKSEQIIFALNGKLFDYQIENEALTEIHLSEAVVDPKISPDSKYVAAVSSDGFKLIELATQSVKTLIEASAEAVTFGLANFIAAEEFSRISGFWWSPDSKNLLVEKVESTQVTEIQLAYPTDPRLEIRKHRYPFACSKNPTSSLILINIEGEAKDLSQLSCNFEYLVNAGFKNESQIFVTALNREQNHLEVKLYDLDTLDETVFFTQKEDPWVEVFQPLPKFFDDHFVYLTGEELQTINLNGQQIPGQNFEVRTVLSATESKISALVSTSPINQALVELSAKGELSWITPSDSYVSAIKKEAALVLVKHDLQKWQPEYEFRLNEKSFKLDNLSPAPSFKPNIAIEYLKETDLYAAVIAPSNYQNEKLPVVMSPYSGPHAQRVLNSATGYLTEQFLANQGFLVVVIDSRGTPGRGKEFAQSISSNWSKKVLRDQIEGLEELATLNKWNFDLTKVGIKGWSFGGYLAALAVLVRSDFFKAAIAGAPVTDWRWYDTAYSERYLGQPDENSERYEENSLINKVDGLTSPLLLIHGLADDNVLAMHSLQLSAALFAKGKGHNFLSLSGVSHMTQGASTLESLLKLEVDFFVQHLKS
ncbi:MAG: prolyl oligopeptidase family serine peptidase [Candidatus Nanopelagicales bacterium]